MKDRTHIRITSALFAIFFTGWLIGATGFTIFCIVSEGGYPVHSPGADFLMWTGGIIAAVGVVGLALKFIVFLVEHAITGEDLL